MFGRGRTRLQPVYVEDVASTLGSASAKGSWRDADCKSVGLTT
jgi:hypothetical protein